MNLNRPSHIVIGQEVFVVEYRRWAWENSHQLAKVSKITPTGQVTVDVPANPGLVEYRFTPNDREIGGDRCLAWNVEELKARLVEGAAMREVEAKLCVVRKVEFRHTYGREAANQAIAEMRAALDAAEAALKP